MKTIILVLSLVCSATASLAQSSSKPAIALPQHPAQWLNASPISAAALQGKGAVFYYFEEG